MKRTIEVEVQDGLFCFCSSQGVECDFFIWEDGGCYQHCGLYRQDVQADRYDDKGNVSGAGIYRTKKCAECLHHD